LRLTVAWLGAEASILPECAANVDLPLTLVVKASARLPNRAWRIDAVAVGASAEACQDLVNFRMRLSWETETVVVAGQRLSATVRLRPPGGLANPGGFDYRRWLLASGYAATGYIKSAQLTGQTPNTFKYRLVSYLEGLGLVRLGLIRALILGDGTTIEPKDWELFRHTGTIHLLVISGLHISLIAALLYTLIQLLVLPFTARRLGLIAQWAGLWGTLAAAIGMAIWTEFGAPIMRVSITVLLFILMRLMGRHVAAWRIVVVSAYVFLLLQPLHVAQSGFWLSYGAVLALLWFFEPRVKAYSTVGAFVRAQWVLSVAFAPWTALILGQFSVLMLAANLITVPLIMTLTLPALLLAILLYLLDVALAETFFSLADFSLYLFKVVLSALYAQPVPGVQGIETGFLAVPFLLIALGAGLWCTLPLSGLARYLPVFGFIGVCLSPSSGVPYGNFCVRVVDVGQGSAAIMDTARILMMIDAGPRLRSGDDLFERGLLPFLRTTGPERLTLFLLSHGDDDHAGGAASLINHFSQTATRGVETPCSGRETWMWDGVRFSLLIDHAARTENDRSCTLLIETKAASAFLSGDIGRAAEQRLINLLPRGVDFLVAPHHGSRSSSSLIFVRRLAPKIVVFSAGKQGRYRHPHDDVVRRYRREGSAVFNTAEQGAVQWCSHQPRRLRVGGSERVIILP
tara:strand:+ start:2484 stop:4541 length:2058 start_codon:yes stop_codon:yes gene_type:complete